MIKTLEQNAQCIKEMLTPEELIQVCIGKFDILLNFTQELSISILSKCEICSESKVIEVIADRPDLSKELTSLLGNIIQDHSINENVLEIFFSNSTTLRIFVDGEESNYESLSITKKESRDYTHKRIAG